MLDRLTGLEVFAKVAAAGSLSAAGRAIGLSQTMVTKHIAALEARLGVKLFHRSTRRLSITEAGRNYLEASERILADIEAADAAVAADRVEPRGLLRLNAPVAFGARQIAPLLSEFAHHHPGVTVELGLNDPIAATDFTPDRRETNSINYHTNRGGILGLDLAQGQADRIDPGVCFGLLRGL